MSITIDARGYSCPQPVLMTLEEIKKAGQGEIVVLVDTDTSKENVARTAANQGWTVKDAASEGEGYRVTLTK